MAEIMGLLTTLSTLIVRIQTIANNVRAARKSALYLANRVQTIQVDLLKIEELPENQIQAHEHHLIRFQKIYYEVEKFLLKMQRTGVKATVKRILKNGKYAQQYSALHTLLNDAIFDFTLSLTINTPNQNWDGEDPAPSGQPHTFPPNLSETAPNAPAMAEDEVANAPGIDVEEEPSNFEPIRPDDILIPWDMDPRKKADTEGVVGIVSESVFGSVSKSFESKKNIRRDHYSRIHMLRNVPQNTRISVVRVILCKLEQGDTTATVRAAQAVSQPLAALGFFGSIPLIIGGMAIDAGCYGVTSFTREEPVTGGLTCASLRILSSVTATKEIFCHYAIEFQLANGLVGTIENCVNDVDLYEGTSKRAEKHGVLVADLELLNINRTLSDLIRMRNDHRKTPYSVTKNNCKHFAFNAFKALVGEVNGRDLNRDTFEGFRNSCQNAYVAVKGGTLKHHVIVYNEDDQLIWEKNGPVSDYLSRFGD